MRVVLTDPGVISTIGCDVDTYWQSLKTGRSGIGFTKILDNNENLYHITVPPPINYRNPGPECDLDYVPNKVRPKDIKSAITTSFGFWSSNDVLAERK